MNVIVRIDGCNSKKNNGLENQRLGSKIKSDCINDESYVSQKKKCLRCKDHKKHTKSCHV